MFFMERAFSTIFVISFISKTTKCDEACQPGERLEQVIFSKKVNDRILEGFVASMKPVSNDKECQMLCILNRMCNSYNLGVQDSSFHHSCQVLRFGFGNYTVKKKNGWSFRARKCLSSPCLNGGTCFTIDKSNIPRCACPPDWSGQTCSELPCPQPLGMESGAISDAQITTSTRWVGWDGHHARLNNQKVWVAAALDANQWLQIDLGNQGYGTTLTRVASQGRNYIIAQYITMYRLQYSDDGVNFQYYREQGQNVDKDFVGNTDMDTVVSHDLNPPIEARYIRFLPVTWVFHISMRMEIYGCPVPVSCKSGWKKYYNHCYKISTQAATFSEANSSCTSEGAQLLSIADSEELTYVISFLYHSGVSGIYVGLTDIAEEGNWVWMDGSVPTLDPLWNTDQPNGGLNENCAEYVLLQNMLDVDCNSARQYVCEYTPNEN